MALVPGLNSMFYAMNSSYYARWYYMPVLIMCAVTIYGLEHEDEVDLKKAAPHAGGAAGLRTRALRPGPTGTHGVEDRRDGLPGKVLELRHRADRCAAVLGAVAHVQAHPPWPRAAHRGGACLRLPVRRGAISPLGRPVGRRQGSSSVEHGGDGLGSRRVPRRRAPTASTTTNVTTTGLRDERSDLQTFNSTVAPSILEGLIPRWVKRTCARPGGG